MANFELAFAFVLGNEGGLEENPKDPGGITKYGLSLRFMRELDPNFTADDIRNLSIAQAQKVYEENFWLPIYAEIVAQKICNYIFDMGVNQSPAEACKLTQRALRTTAVDGVFGDKTLAAVNAFDPELLINRMIAQRTSFYYELVAEKPALAPFLSGWIRRAHRVG